MCCTVGWPGPAPAPVAGRRTVLELDITAAAAAPAGHKIDWSREMHCYKWVVNGLLFWWQANITLDIVFFWQFLLPRGKWDVKVWGGTAGVPICSPGALLLMIWMLAGIRWCKLLEWPWNAMKAAQVFSNQHKNIHTLTANVQHTYLLTTDRCHRNRWGCGHAALYANSNVTRHLGGYGNMTLVGSWCRGNKTTWHRGLQDSLK